MYTVKNELTGEEFTYGEYWEAIKAAGKIANNYFNRYVIAIFDGEKTIIIKSQKESKK